MHNAILYKPFILQLSRFTTISCNFIDELLSIDNHFQGIMNIASLQ